MGVAMMKITKPEIAVLELLSPETFYLRTFAYIAEKTGMARRSVVTAVRRLVRKGDLERDAAFNECDGLLCGSGFMVTPQGKTTLTNAAQAQGGQP